MKLNKDIKIEDVEKLNQLDRIEYRQRLYELERRKPEHGIWNFLNFFYFIIGFLILLAVSMLNYAVESAMRMFNLIPVIAKVAIIAVILLMILHIYLYSMWKKELDKWNDKYFKLKLEVKK